MNIHQEQELKETVMRSKKIAQDVVEIKNIALNLQFLLKALIHKEGAVLQPEIDPEVDL